MAAVELTVTVRDVPGVVGGSVEPSRPIRDPANPPAIPSTAANTSVPVRPMVRLRSDVL